jgi:hypothetical protein
MNPFTIRNTTQANLVQTNCYSHAPFLGTKQPPTSCLRANPQALRVTGTVFLDQVELAGLVASPVLRSLELEGLRRLDGRGVAALLPVCGELTPFRQNPHICLLFLPPLHSNTFIPSFVTQNHVSLATHFQETSLSNCHYQMAPF